MKQDDLFKHPHPFGPEYETPAGRAAWEARKHARRNDAGTSHAAAVSVERNAKALMEQIWRDLVRHGPATFSEVATRLHLPEGRVWKRLSDLKNANRVIDSGLTRKGSSGRLQTVWRAVGP